MTIEEIQKIKDTNEKLYNDLEREPLLEEIAIEIGFDLTERRYEMEFALAYENEDYTPDPSLKVKMTIKNNEMEKARKGLGLEQQQLAEKVGVKMGTICHIECCRTYPEVEIQEKISKVLGISKEVLFPQWLKSFSEKWKKQEKEKIIPIKEILIGSNPEFLMLESGDEEEMIHSADSEIMRKNILKTMSLYLRPKEQKILELRYGLDGKGQRTLDEIGAEFGVTRERVRQLEYGAYEKIKEPLEKFRNK